MQRGKIKSNAVGGDNISKKEQSATKLVLTHWMKKLDKSLKMMAMAFEDHAEAHQNVMETLALFVKENEDKIAKLQREIAELKRKKAK